MLTETSDISRQVEQNHFLTEEEDLAIMEDLARTNFGMSLDEFTQAWKAGRFDDDKKRHGDVVSLAMMLPEYWND